MSKMKYNCEIIRDLLPLYQDNVCSDASREIVKEHLAECRECNRIAEKLSDTEIDECLTADKTSVLKNHNSKEKRRAVKVGIITAVVLMIPVIVCLIVNIATGHGLDWFFIVLTALMLVASITVVPMLVYEKKFFYSVLAGTFSLVLLLLSCCIYAQGDWFFLVTIPTIFGLSVVLMPFMLSELFRENNEKIAQRLSEHKGFITMLWDSIWLYATIVVCGLHSVSPDYWRTSLSTTTVCVIIPWAIFLILRYTKSNGMLKTGYIMGFLGIYMLFAQDVIMLMIYGKWDMRISHMDFTTWKYTEGMGEAAAAACDANINCLAAFACLLIGIIFYVIGRNIKRKNTNNYLKNSNDGVSNDG